MSWESIDRWPGESRQGGAFRGSAEPVLASRSAPSAPENLVIWWRSTPELPYARTARQVALTSHYVYVERYDGSRERVPLSKLRGRRRDRRLMRYGVVDGEDLVLPHRRGCDLQADLARRLRGAPGRMIVARHGVLGAILLAVFAGFLASVFGAETSMRGIEESFEHGLLTSEALVMLYAAAFSALVAAWALLWIPSRYRVDDLGVERARGLVPWLPFHRPPEDFGSVIVDRTYVQKNGRRYVTGYMVHLQLKHADRFGSFVKLWRVRIDTASQTRERNLHQARKQIRAEAHRLRDLLSIPLNDTVRGETHDVDPAPARD